MSNKKETVKEERCGTCAHYFAHYALIPDRSHLVRLDYGHCDYPRLKDREQNQACQFWKENQAGKPNEKAPE